MFDWITGWIEQLGYTAVAVLMFAENLFPPIPSELVMPLSGYTASQGDLNLWGVLAAGWAGSMLGALFWYGIGYWVGLERIRRFAARHGRWLTMTPEEVGQANDWFHRHGGKAVFFGRLVPAVRTFISIPAGVSDMSFMVFLLYTAVGTALWTAFLTALGYILGSSYDQISTWMNPVTDVVVGLILIWYLWRVATFGRRRRRSA